MSVIALTTLPVPDASSAILHAHADGWTNETWKFFSEGCLRFKNSLPPRPSSTACAAARQASTGATDVRRYGFPSHFVNKSERSGSSLPALCTRSTSANNRLTVLSRARWFGRGLTVIGCVWGCSGLFGAGSGLARDHSGRIWTRLARFGASWSPSRLVWLPFGGRFKLWGLGVGSPLKQHRFR